MPLSAAMRVDMKLIRIHEVRNRIGYSKATIYRKVSIGEFPRPYNLGARAVAWLESEIDSWIAERVEARTQKDGATCQ